MGDQMPPGGGPAFGRTLAEGSAKKAAEVVVSAVVGALVAALLAVIGEAVGDVTGSLWWAILFFAGVALVVIIVMWQWLAPWVRRWRMLLTLRGVGALLGIVVAVVAVFGASRDDDGLDGGATPLPSFELATFSDTFPWFPEPDNTKVQGIPNPDSAEEGDGMLRFAPPGRQIPVGAYREPMDDVSLRPYCSVRFAVRLNDLGETRLGSEPGAGSAVVYLWQGEEELAYSFADRLDEGSTAWQEVEVAFVDLRGGGSSPFYDKDAPVTRLGFRFALPTAGGTIDLDWVDLEPCEV